MTDCQLLTNLVQVAAMRKTLHQLVHAQFTMPKFFGHQSVYNHLAFAVMLRRQQQISNRVVIMVIGKG